MFIAPDPVTALDPIVTSDWTVAGMIAVPAGDSRGLVAASAFADAASKGLMGVSVFTDFLRPIHKKCVTVCLNSCGLRNFCCCRIQELLRGWNTYY